MIVKFFNRGKGGGNGPVDYLLGKDRERELAKLDQGDPDEIINLINSCEFTQKYKSGCLSFKEGDLPQAVKDKIMRDFEVALLPGLDKNQYSILWVEHRDKGRLELNFVIPCVELTTGKRLQPYYHAIDEQRIDTWKKCVNTALNLHSPDAPENKRLDIPSNVTGLPTRKKDLIEYISNTLLYKLPHGLIKNNSDVVRTLNGLGFTITRHSQNTISIKDPNGGKNIKLKGSIYEKSFQHVVESPLKILEKSVEEQAAYQKVEPEEFERNKVLYGELLNKKAVKNIALYSRKVVPSENIQEKITPIAGVENDRVRNPLIESVGEIIKRSGDYVSRVQDHFGKVGKSFDGARQDLSKTAGRKPNPDSVSKYVGDSSERYNRTVGRCISGFRAVERNSAGRIREFESLSKELDQYAGKFDERVKRAIVDLKESHNTGMTP